MSGYLDKDELRRTLKILKGTGEWKAADRLQDHIAALEADNAALATFIRTAADRPNDRGCLECGWIGHHGVGCELGAVARQDHPGTALLEEHKKTLAEAERRYNETWSTLHVREEEHRKALEDKDAEIAMHLRSIDQLVGDGYKRALVRARNEGLEMAASVVESADDGVPLQMLADDGIRALKGPEE